MNLNLVNNVVILGQSSECYALPVDWIVYLTYICLSCLFAHLIVYAVASEEAFAGKDNGKSTAAIAELTVRNMLPRSPGAQQEH